MTTAELPSPLVFEDPVGSFKDALEAGDLTAKRLAEDFARGYAGDINEMTVDGETGGEIRQKELAYWRFCPNPRCANLGHRSRTGYIYPGPSSRGLHGRAQAEDFASASHSVSLEDRYGSYQMNHVDVNGLRHSGQYDPAHPEGVYETLIKIPGGIFEFPLSQFLQQRFHHSPRLLGARQDAQRWIAQRRAEDPTLNEYGEIPCDLGCADRTFLNKDDYATHQESVHREHKASVAAAREFSKAIVQSQRDNNAALNEIMTSVSGGDGNAAIFAKMLELIDNQNKMMAPLLAAAAQAQPSGIRPPRKPQE